jgi:hypothetical protein
MMTALGPRFIALMPMAATVPTMVATVAETNAMIKVLRRDWRIVTLSNSARYHRSENPPQVPRDRESLNEKMISTAIGAYKKRKIKPV